MTLHPIDRAIVEATQAGLPLVPAPFEAVAETLGVSETELLERLDTLKKQGVIRRIGAAPNHYKLGLVSNGMTVWDIDDAAVDQLGEKVGALPYVTHSYRRPRALPEWPYNLFAMVHGQTRDEVLSKQQKIAEILGAFCRSNDILFSTRILKKTGLRLRKKDS